MAGQARAAQVDRRSRTGPSLPGRAGVAVRQLLAAAPRRAVWPSQRSGAADATQLPASLLAGRRDAPQGETAPGVSGPTGGVRRRNTDRHPGGAGGRPPRYAATTWPTSGGSGTDSRRAPFPLSLIHISEPTRRTPISYAVFCLKKKKKKKQ